MEFSSKLREARSRLYRRRFLHVDTRWKALDEIYRFTLLLHRSDLKISAESRQHFFANEISMNNEFPIFHFLGGILHFF